LVILACTVFDWFTHVMDRQTDRWTELRWLRHAEATADVARKKTKNIHFMLPDFFTLLWNKTSHHTHYQNSSGKNIKTKK